MAERQLPTGLVGIDQMNTVGEVDSSVPDMLTPAVQGAYYFKWMRLPEFVNQKAWHEVMRVLTNKITLPAFSIGTSEMVNGFSGTTKIQAPTNAEVTNEVTIGFNEMQGYPIMELLEEWVYSIRDPHTGLSSVEDYTLRNISGDLLCILTKPVHSSNSQIIERAFYFRHIFPKQVPIDTLSPSKESSDKVAYEIAWAYKNLITNENTIKYASEILPEIQERIGSWDTVKIEG